MNNIKIVRTWHHETTELPVTLTPDFLQGETHNAWHPNKDYQASKKIGNHNAN